MYNHRTRSMVKCKYELRIYPIHTQLVFSQDCIQFYCGSNCNSFSNENILKLKFKILFKYIQNILKPHKNTGKSHHHLF